MTVSPTADFAANVVRVLKTHLNAAEAALAEIAEIGMLDFDISDSYRYDRQIGKIREVSDLASELSLPTIEERAAALLERFGA